MAAKKSGRALPRPFSLHWGSGEIVEEATCRTEYHEPCLQLLQFEDGAVCIRFCYFDLEGRFQRSPLIIGEDDIEPLRSALGKNKKLKALLKKLVD